MTKEQLVSQIKQKRIELLVKKTIKEPKIIAVACEVMETESSAVKFGAEKVIRLVSEKDPKLVYPYFDRLVKMTKHENSFLKWGAYLTLANLAAVDKKNKFEKVFAEYFKPITGPQMVTAANIVGGAAKIAQAKPKLADRIAKEILKVEKGIYKHKEKVSPECRQVVCGTAIDSLEIFFDLVSDKKQVLDFVKRQLSSTRPQVVKGAKKFVKNNE